MTSFNDGTPASAPSTFMTLAEARPLITGGVLQLPSTAIRNDRVDQAIRDAGDEFVRKVRPLRNEDNENTTKDQDTVVLVRDGFLPRYLVRVDIEDGDGFTRTLERPDLRTVIRRLRDGHDGVPKQIAARAGGSEFVLEPVPDDVYKLTFVWTPPFVSFTPGTDSPADVVLNIPRDMMHGVLRYGVPAYYERGNEQARFVREARQQFDRHIMECRGLVDSDSMGGHITVNEDAY